jgi:hypothetical protein
MLVHERFGLAVTPPRQLHPAYQRGSPSVSAILTSCVLNWHKLAQCLRAHADPKIRIRKSDWVCGSPSRTRTGTTFRSEDFKSGLDDHSSARGHDSKGVVHVVGHVATRADAVGPPVGQQIGPPNETDNVRGGPATDSLENALSRAIDRASEAQQWGLLAALLAELRARRGA